MEGSYASRSSNTAALKIIENGGINNGTRLYGDRPLDAAHGAIEVEADAQIRKDGAENTSGTLDRLPFYDQIQFLRFEDGHVAQDKNGR